MPTVDKSIVVNAPVERVYDLWTDFERFPEFMENVKQVRRTGEDRTHWTVEVMGQSMEWDADVVDEQPNRLVAWRAWGEAGQSGRVTFEPLGPDRTRVSVSLSYEMPNQGAREKAAQALGIDDRVVENDLERFRRIAEGHPAT